MTPTWLGVAEALDKAQDWPGLLVHCRRWTQADPDDADAWHSLGLAYALSGNRSEALEAVKELWRYDPKKAEKLFNFIMQP